MLRCLINQTYKSTIELSYYKFPLLPHHQWYSVLNDRQQIMFNNKKLMIGNVSMSETQIVTYLYARKLGDALIF